MELQHHGTIYQKKLRLDPGLQAFFENNVYKQSEHFTLYTFLCKTMGILYTVFQNLQNGSSAWTAGELIQK